MRLFTAVAAALLAAGCASDEPSGETKAEGEKPAADDPTPRELPTEWAASITNPWLPLEAGASWTYEKTAEDATEEVVITVTDKTKTIEGITATVVKERVTEDGELLEKTNAWYAQDSEGNVWNLGDRTKAYEDGKVETEGWQVGVDGAKAGIAMLAEPKVGDIYLQMYLEGDAEDRSKVRSTDESIEGPAGSWTGVLQTEDTTPLEPELLEYKYFARDVGPVEQRTVKGEKEKVVLVKYEKP
jgi:hypothetical protein